LTKKLSALVISGLLLGALLAPSPAQARPFAGAATCNVNLPQWPGAGSATCNGTAVGIDVAAPAACVATCAFQANVTEYSEICVLGEPPLIGSAKGTLVIGGAPQGAFTWTRVGLTAVIASTTNPAGEALGVAAFAPLTLPPPTCENPGPLNAQVAGVAVSI